MSQIVTTDNNQCVYKYSFVVARLQNHHMLCFLKKGSNVQYNKASYVMLKKLEFSSLIILLKV